MNRDQDQDLLQINALVDGELSPSERAQIAARMAADRNLARSHATLARLKACITEISESEEAMTTAGAVAAPRRRFAMRITATAALALVTAGIGFLVFEATRPAAIREQGELAITRAAFPVRPAIPDFASAGLTLQAVELRRPAGGPVLVATYAGPRGCRLELRVHGGDAAADNPQGSRRHGWRVNGLSYELSAFGMPEARFAIIAAAAERQTLINTDPDAVERQLRQARLAAPPCVG